MERIHEEKTYAMEVDTSAQSPIESGAAILRFVEDAVFGEPLEAIWKNCILGLCGVPTVHRRMFNVVVTSTEADRGGWLNEVAETIERFFPKQSPGTG